MKKISYTEATEAEQELFWRAQELQKWKAQCRDMIKEEHLRRKMLNLIKTLGFEAEDKLVAFVVATYNQLKKPNIHEEDILRNILGIITRYSTEEIHPISLGSVEADLKAATQEWEQLDTKLDHIVEHLFP